MMINVATTVYHGHMQVQREGYLEDPSIRKVIHDASEVRAAVQAVPGVVAVSTRGQAFALASSEERTFGVQVVGVVPEEERQVSSLPSNVRIGTYLGSHEGYEAVIGAPLARNLRVELGDEVTLLGQGQDGSLAASVVTVVGIFESGAREVDSGMIHIPYKTFTEIFSMPEAAHSLVLKLEDLDDDRAVQTRLIRALPSDQKLRALRWDELMPGMKQSIELDMVSGWFFYFGLILVVVFSILNTFLMSVLERTREFGVMLAIGVRLRELRSLLYIEATLLTLVGLLLGMFFGSLIVFYFGFYGFYVPGSEEALKIWNLPAAIYTRISLASLFIGPSVILIVSYISLLYPSYLLGTLQPIEAMRRQT